MVYRGRILGRNPDKILKSFPPCYSQSHLYSFALRFLFLKTHATSYSLYSSVTVHCKEVRKKTWQKTIPPSLLFKNPYRNLKSENSQVKLGNFTKIVQCTFMNLAIVQFCNLSAAWFLNWKNYVILKISQFSISFFLLFYLFCMEYFTHSTVC